MNQRQNKIAFLSRDKTFIIRTTFGIGLFFFTAGFLIHFFASQPDTSTRENPAPKTARDYAKLIRSIGDNWQNLNAIGPGLDPKILGPGGLQLPDLIAQTTLPGNQSDLLSRFLSALTTNRDAIDSFRTYFESVHAENPTTPLAAGFAAYLHAIAGNNTQALDLYIAEGAFPGASFERRAAITIATKSKDRATLETILPLPGFREQIPRHLEDQVAIITRDFSALLSNQFAHWFRVLHPGYFAVSLINGSIWLIIIFLTLALKKRHLPIAFVSVAAGIFSTAVTLALYSLQNFYTGVALTGSLVDDAVYWIAGVGLREEFAKLLCFAVLIPFLRPFNSGALAFACASFVGLGFAIEENNQYFNGTLSSAALPRFLTANFLHLATTGIAGYHLYQLSFGFKRRWEPALGAFLFVVVLHGAYDFLPSTPLEISREIGIASIFIIGILAFNHAKMTGQLRIHDRSHPVSPLAVFVFGTALILGLSFTTYIAGLHGEITFAQAVSGFGKASLSAIVVAFLFINRFRSA